MATVAELNVKIGADLRDFNRQMDGLRQKLAPVGENFKQFGKTASTYVTAPLVAAGAGMLKMASDAEEMQTKFNVVFKNTGDGVTQRLDEFGESVGRSVFELKGMAAQLGDTLKPMGFAEDAAAGLAVDLTKLATDLSSFNNMPMDEALRRLQGTLVGSHENALAFGVVINENTLKAQMLEDGTADLTGAQFEQAKVQARINLLMQGTTDAQGDAARTAEGFANRVRALRANLEEVAIELGAKLIPIATRVVEKITSMASWVSDLSDRNQKLILIIGGVAAAIGPLSIAIGAVITAISPWSVAIAAVIAAGTALVANWDSIKGWVDSNMPLVSQGIGVAFDVIKGLLSTIMDSFKNAWDWIANYLSTAVEVITGIAGVFFDVFTGNWSGAWEGIKEIFGAVWDGLTEAFRIALDQIKNLMPGFVKDWLGWTDSVEKDTVKITEALDDTAKQTEQTAKSFAPSGALSSQLSSFTKQLDTTVVPAVQEASKAAAVLETDIAAVAPAATQLSSSIATTSGNVRQMGKDLDATSVELRTLKMDVEEADQATGNFRTSLVGFGSGFMDAMNGFDILFGGIGGKFGQLIGHVNNLTNTLFPALKLAFNGINSALGALGINLERQFLSVAAAAGGYTALLTAAGAVGIFGYGLAQMFGDNHTSLLEQGINPGTLTTATDLGTLLGGDISAGGLEFGGWGDFSNLGGWQGQPAQITLNIDGRTFAEATMPYMEREIELNIG